MFFVFDGMDGAGKTTQLNLFAEWLIEQEHEVVCCKDPGTTRLGDRMRDLLLGNHPFEICMSSELLMFMTARAQLVHEVIRPALEAGKTVVCDRFVFSTVVYQGYAGDINPDQVWELNQFATGNLTADMTFLFQLDAKTAHARLGETLDRMESRGIEYFEKLRAGFIAESKRWPTGVELIDADQRIEEIQSQIQRLAATVLDAD